MNLALYAPVVQPDPVLSGRCLYVANDGDDANSGECPACAFATLQAGIDAMVPGDTLLVAPGEYAGATFLPCHSGTATGWKKVMAQDPTRKPVITAPGPNTQRRGSFIELYGNEGTNMRKTGYIWLSNLVVRGGIEQGVDANTAPAECGRYGFDFVNTAYTRIDHCEAYNVRITGIFAAFADWFVCEYNHSEHNGEHGYYFNNGGDNFIFRANSAAYNRGCGYHLNADIDTPPSKGWHENGTYEYNLSTHNGSGWGGRISGAGLNFSGLRRGIIRYNCSLDDYAGGMTFYQGDSKDTSRDCQVYNNLVVLNRISNRAPLVFDNDAPRTDTDNELMGKPLHLYFWNNVFASKHHAHHLVEANHAPVADPQVHFCNNIFVTPGAHARTFDMPAEMIEGIRANNHIVARLDEVFVAANMGDYTLLDAWRGIGTKA